MIVTILLSALIAFWLFVNVRKMIKNARSGRSLCGCGGDCEACCCCKEKK